MDHAIVGFGKIGHALAKAFARNGMAVSVATTRGPESFASDAAAIGPELWSSSADEHDAPTGRDATHAIGSSAIRSTRDGGSYHEHR